MVRHRRAAVGIPEQPAAFTDIAGNTLRANNLVEVEHVMPISSHLVVNQAALKLKQQPIRRLIDTFAQAVQHQKEAA